VRRVPHDVQPVHEVKANLFRVLGHPARVRILELLRDGERSVGALQTALGLDSGGTSQHLAALRRIGLVESRREGTSVYYRVADERVFDLLEAGRGIITRRLAEQQSILQDLETT
jgi:DNA-binding transcriptional ArsR family regulator